MQTSKKYFLLIILFVSAVIVAGCVNQQSSQDNSTTSVQPIGEVKEFNMIAKQWEFQPSIITVNKGDLVKLNIKSIDVAHGFGLREFNVSTFLQPGQTTDVEFLANKSGTYSFFCNISCGAGHSSMRGTLIVQ